jgi:hypothetical protein
MTCQNAPFRIVFRRDFSAADGTGDAVLPAAIEETKTDSMKSQENNRQPTMFREIRRNCGRRSGKCLNKIILPGKRD